MLKFSTVLLFVFAINGVTRAEEFCDFAKRLESTNTIKIVASEFTRPGGSTDTMSGFEKTGPFLCINQYSDQMLPGDTENSIGFKRNCLAKTEVPPTERDDYKQKLIALYEIAPASIKKLLCANKLKRLVIEKGAPFNAANFYLQNQTTIHFNSAMFDDDFNLSTFMSYYDQFRTGNRTERPLERYQFRANETRWQFIWQAQFAKTLAGPVGILLKAVTHELGHFLHGEFGIIDVIDETEELGHWTDTTFPELSWKFMLPVESESKRYNDLYFEKNHQLGLVRQRVCAGGEANSILGGNENLTSCHIPKFGQELHDASLAMAASEYINWLAALNPKEDFCETVSLNLVADYASEISIYPGQTSQAIDFLAKLARPIQQQKAAYFRQVEQRWLDKSISLWRASE